VILTLNWQSARRIWFPREHGAWAMTFSPLISGFIVAGALRWTGFWLLVAVLAFFLIRQPAVAIVRAWTHQKQVSLPVYLLFASELLVILLAGGLVLWLQPAMIWFVFGGLAAFSLLAYLYFVSRRQEMTPIAEVVTVSGVCVGAAAGYFAGHGAVNNNALALILLNLAYFVPNIFFIRLKARTQARQAPPESWSGYWQAGRTLLLVNAAGWLLSLVGVMAGIMPGIALLALLPNTLKDIWGVVRWHTRTELNIRRRGYAEVGHLFLFLALLAGLLG